MNNLRLKLYQRGVFIHTPSLSELQTLQISTFFESQCFMHPHTFIQHVGVTILTKLHVVHKQLGCTCSTNKYHNRTLTDYAS